MASRSAWEASVARAGVADRVRLAGARDDGAMLVAGFDVAVLSSWYEGMPRTVVEAVAHGVPVVASDVGSVDHLVEHGVSGRLVPVGDRAALAAALTDAHRHPDRLTRMAAAARARVDDYSASKMRRDLADLWFSVARGQREPTADEGPIGSVTTVGPRS